MTGIDYFAEEERFEAGNIDPAGVLGWLTGQTYIPLYGYQIKLNVKFDNDCMSNKPGYTLCFPTVSACAREITLPVAPMSTFEEFKRVFLTAFSKGQPFGCP